MSSSSTKTKCQECSGTGKYRKGSVINGVFIATYENTCYRCQGKGYQSDKDIKRNSNYDNYHRRV